MEWIPREKIEAAGKKSLKAALEMSILHHLQLRQATSKKLQKANTKWGNHIIGDDYCALCRRYAGKGEGCEKKCPLKDNSWICCSEWVAVWHLFCPTEETLSAFRQAETKLINKMQRIYKNRYGKKYIARPLKK